MYLTEISTAHEALQRARAGYDRVGAEIIPGYLTGIGDPYRPRWAGRAPERLTLEANLRRRGHSLKVAADGLRPPATADEGLQIAWGVYQRIVGQHAAAAQRSADDARRAETREREARRKRARSDVEATQIIFPAESEAILEAIPADLTLSRRELETPEGARRLLAFGVRRGDLERVRAHLEGALTPEVFAEIEFPEDDLILDQAA